MIEKHTMGIPTIGNITLVDSYGVICDICKTRKAPCFSILGIDKRINFRRFLGFPRTHRHYCLNCLSQIQANPKEFAFKYKLGIL